MQDRLNRKKILMISHSSGLTGGGEDDFLRLIRFFYDRYCLFLVVPKGPRLEIYEKFSDECFVIPDGIFPFEKFKIKRYVKYLIISIYKSYKLLPYLIKIRNEVDVCFINSSTCLIETLLVSILGIPFVMSVKEIIEPQFVRRLIYRFYRNTASDTIVISKMLKLLFDSTDTETGAKVVYSSIEESVFKINKAALKGKKRTDNDLFRLVNIGVISPIKNQELLLKALQKVNTKRKIKVDFVGRVIDPSYENTLNKLSFFVGENVDVRFIPEMRKEDVAKMIYHADCIVITSKLEGMSLVFAESLFLGTPVISTRVGVVPEIIRNGENGFLVDSQNPDELTAVLNSFLEGGVIRGDITSEYTEQYLKYFNQENYLISHEKIILACVKEDWEIKNR